MSSVTIGIAGGTGGMGRWFELFFNRAGYKVRIAGRKTELTYADLARTCDVVAVSTPVAPAIEIVKEIGPQMTGDQLLMDFCSQKADIVEAMAAATNADVIGTHPMFAPQTPSLEGQNVILCPAASGSSGKWLPWLESLLKGEGAVVTQMAATEHDRKMAISQSLMHFLTITLARMFQRMGLQAEDAFLFATPVFRLNVDLAGRLFSQDLTLYADLVSKNRHAPEIVEAFTTAADECRKTFFDGNYDGLLSFLHDLRNFLGDDFCRTALSETNMALNSLYEAVKESKTTKDSNKRR